jgi:hypothetical protein
MTATGAIVTLSPRDCDAVIFDLDSAYFAQRSDRHGIEIRSADVDLVRSLRAQAIGTALLFSGSDAAVLEAAGIAPLFDVRVDGRNPRRDRHPMRFWKRRGGSGSNRRERSCWRIRSPESRPRGRAGSAWSSASTASAGHKPCARPAPMPW